MNNKGEVNLGVILMAFIGIIVGLALVTAIASSAGQSSATGYSNGTTTGGQQVVPGVLGTVTCLTGQELLDTPTVANATGTYLAPNWTISEGVCTTTGVKSVLYTQDSNNGTTLTYNVTYTYGVDGYVESSGARAVIGLIIIFFVLSIVVIAIEPTLGSGITDMVNGK